MTTALRSIVMSLFLILAYFCAWPHRDALAQTSLHPPATPVPESYFGMHFHHLEFLDWPSAHFGSIRLWDSFDKWFDLEPKKGAWAWQRLDKQMAIATEHHVQVLFTFGSTPTWASARPNESTTSSQPGNTAEPKDMNDWRDFVRAVATRYKGRIQAYEIWNEPNSKQFFTGKPETLVAMARDAYKILHEIDPSVVVVSPPIAGGHVEYLDAYLRAGGGEYCDVIGYHFYVSPAPPEEMVRWIEQVKGIMAKYGQSRKPLWNTEVGYYVQSADHEVKPDGPFIVTTYEQHAAYISRAYILNWAAGVSRLNWYAWDDGSEGLAEKNGKLKPSAEAYDHTAQWLTGAEMKSCTSDSSDTWVCELTRPGQYNAHLVWNTKGTRKFAIPSNWNARWQQNLNAPARKVEGVKETEVGIKPILLENRA